MQSGQPIEKLIPGIVSKLAHCRQCTACLRTEKGMSLTGQHAVLEVLHNLVSVLFPGCHEAAKAPPGGLNSYLAGKLRRAAAALKLQIKHAFEYQCTVDHKKSCKACTDCSDRAQKATAGLLQALPEIRKVLQQDIVAAYEGDPAARSAMEVVISYPGFYAVAVHRIAHELYRNNTPLIPRIMSEYAHSRTGIDIHPGAKIGPGFFIDHGTGVVIGETCIIGRNVKLYQGVTLGALSFEKDRSGRLIKGIKRHPDVGDNVVIYAGATILGGETMIGSGSVIGGNVWLTHSVPPNSKVYNQQPKPLIRTDWKKSAGRDR